MTETEKRVPELRFEGFIDDWEQRKLGDIADIKDSARISNELWVENGIPYLRSSDLVNGELNGELFISKETYEGYASKTGAPQKNDVLFTSGGKVGIVYHKKDESPVYVQGGAVLYVKTSTSNLLDGSFLSIYFSSPRMQIYMDIASSGGTIKHFTLKPANASPIIFPSLSEQQQVGSFFKQLDDTIALHQRKLNLLKLLKQTYLNTLFAQNGENSPALRFAGFSEPWEQRKLGELAEVKTGKAFGSADFNDDGEYLVVTNKNIQDDINGITSVGDRIDIFEETILNNYLLSGNNILVTMDGVNIGKTGKYSNEKAVLAQRVGRLNSEQFEFIYQVTNNNKFLSEMNKLSVGNAIKHISLKQISDYSFEAPINKVEQKKIGTCFKHLDDTIALHKQKVAHLQSMKSIFLNKMFV